MRRRQIKMDRSGPPDEIIHFDPADWIPRGAVGDDDELGDKAMRRYLDARRLWCELNGLRSGDCYRVCEAERLRRFPTVSR